MSLSLFLCLATLSTLSVLANGAIEEIPRSASTNSTSVTATATRVEELGSLSEMSSSLESEWRSERPVIMELGMSTGSERFEPASSPQAPVESAATFTAPSALQRTAGSIPVEAETREGSGVGNETRPPSRGVSISNGVAAELSANGVSSIDDAAKESVTVVKDDKRCSVAFQPVLAEMRAEMNIMFSEDVTINYLSLMLPMKLTTAELCRVMLIRGSDQELIEICYSEVPRVDGESANVVLELESRGVLPSELICDAGVLKRCRNGTLGCGRCDLPSTSALIASLGDVPTSTLCKKTVQVDINHNFACIYSAILTAQRDLSQAYIDLRVPSSSVTLIAHDNVDFYLGNPVYAWMDLTGLSCL